MAHTHLAEPVERARRRRNVPVRPTDEQLAALHERKRKFGYKSLSKYLIERGLRDGEMVEVLDARKVDRLLFELRKHGVNLNQLARRLNAGRRAPSDEQIARLLGALERLLGEISEAVNR